MSSFCKQCSLEMFQEDFRELAGLLSHEDADNGYLLEALCEGCGPTIVNEDGVCMKPDCLKRHNGEV
jgi:hypothetical protein